MAKLKTLLAKELPEWPNEEAVICVQDDDGTFDVKFSNKESPPFLEEDGVWRYSYHGSWGMGGAVSISLGELADDANSAIVTRAEWQAERARLLLNSQPERDQEIKELVELACAKKQPHAFTESDIRAAFEAGANWANGGVKAGAAEYVEKLKGLK